MAAMKISELFNRPPLAGINRSDAEDGGKKSGAAESSQVAGNSQDDRVSISPEARVFARIGEILADEDRTRELRVQDIKRRVQEGSYAVNSSDVAKAVVNYFSSESKG